MITKVRLKFDRRRDDQARAAFDSGCAELRGRLAKISAHMLPGDLDALVITMTRLRMKYQYRCAVADSRA